MAEPLPQVGQVVDGHTYIGGNPALPQSWQAQPQAAPEQTIQEQHPDITTGDRLVAKNFATNPEAIMGYLQKNHPQLLIESNDEGAIRVKRPEEKDWRVLDPDTGVFSGLGEMAKDVGDVLYDIPAGIITGTATAAGGVAGAAGGGIGAIPGAVLAGGGTSAALEGARQGLGSAFGLKNNIDPSQIGMAGAAGAVSPLLFGTGATAAQLAKAGFADDAAALALKSQRGLPSRATSAVIEKFAPNVGGFLSGTGGQAVKDLQKHLPKVQELDANPEAVYGYAEGKINDTLRKMATEESKVYAELGEHIGKEGINAEEAMRPWYEKLKELRVASKADDATPFMKQEYNDFRNTLTKVWGRAKATIGPDGELIVNEGFTNKSPEALGRIQRHLAELADFSEQRGIKAAGSELSPAEQTIARIAKQSYGKVNDTLEAAAPGAKDIKSRIANIIKNRQLLDKEIGTPKKFITRMQQASGSKLQNRAMAKNFQNIDKTFGTSLDEARGVLSATNIFSKEQPILSSLKSRIPAAVLGGIGGYAATEAQGRGSGLPIPGWAVGGALGGALGGPRAVRSLLEFSRKTGGGNINQYAGKTTLPIWNMMQTRAGQKGK